MSRHTAILLLLRSVGVTCDIGVIGLAQFEQRSSASVGALNVLQVAV